jgi:hypothetical protein
MLEGGAYGCDLTNVTAAQIKILALVCKQVDSSQWIGGPESEVISARPRSEDEQVVVVGAEGL